MIPLDDNDFSFSFPNSPTDQEFKPHFDSTQQKINRKIRKKEIINDEQEEKRKRNRINQRNRREKIKKSLEENEKMKTQLSELIDLIKHLITELKNERELRKTQEEELKKCRQMLSYCNPSFDKVVPITQNQFSNTLVNNVTNHVPLHSPVFTSSFSPIHVFQNQENEELKQNNKKKTNLHKKTKENN
ncbi:b-zip transcription factor (eurofung)-related [Anaeramoeba ignava]|uniref:B-zip transcription factor (Eurofung)-related n=1 Tax=Anaeramoeba ignava TaxID=1746090 RepID=A0A9Q0LFR4_ANAIG|nr:b-zip transcription factor (eurofung)-related [Anaeramoeba ignava]